MVSQWQLKGINLVLILILLVSCSPSQKSPGGISSTLSDETWQPLSAEELEMVADMVPDHPREGAIALVNIIHGPDELLARAATGELLRRAGLPLISIYGDVIALPDVLILGDAPVYVELIDNLTEATRRQNFYTPYDLAVLLNIIGFSDEVLPEDVLMEALGLWGKSEDAPNESVVASAAVRALSFQRGQVLFAGADPEDVQIDPLQTLLILAHISSRNWLNEQKIESTSFLDDLVGVLTGVQVVHAQVGLGDACEAIDKITEGALYRGGKTGFKWLDEFYKDTTKNAITTAIQEAVKEKLGEAAAERLGKQLMLYDMLNTLMSVFVLLQGAQLDITSDKDLIHFHHGGDHGGSHAKFEAVATFKSKLSDTQIKCGRLQGWKIPKDGPESMEEFSIKWMIHEPKGSRQLIAPIGKDAGKIYTRGSTGPALGKGSKSTLEVYTATEKPPEVGKIIKTRAIIEAKLDISEIPFKAGDLWSLVDPKQFAIAKSYEIIMDMIKRAGLPNAGKAIRIEYHGKDIYLGHGIRKINAAYVDVPINVIFWTCDGVEGQWYSWTSFRVDEHVLKEIWTEAFGKIGRDFTQIPYGYQEYEEGEFNIMPYPGIKNKIYLFTPMWLSGELVLTQVPEVGVHIDGVIGEMEVFLAGHSFAEADEYGGSPFKIPIEGVDGFDQCPAPKYIMGTE